MSQTYPVAGDRASTREGEYIRSVYNWMLTGLALTGGVAYFTAHYQPIRDLIYGNPFLFLILLASNWLWS